MGGRIPAQDEKRPCLCRDDVVHRVLALRKMARLIDGCDDGYSYQGQDGENNDDDDGVGPPLGTSDIPSTE